MQPRRLLLAAAIGALAAAALSAPGFAQTAPKKRILLPPPPAVDLTLPAPKPTSSLTTPGVARRLGGLVGMSPVGDQAPACRAQCSKDRYVCHAAGDPADCDSRWIPCLQACSAR